MRTILKYLLLSAVLFSCGTKQQTEPREHQHQADRPNAKVMDNHLALTESQIRLANITTQQVTWKPIGESTAINGVFAVNKEKTEVISSRASGRVEKIFVKETGVSVRKGEPLYQLYSENLLTLQQEYLLARDQYEALGKTEKRYKSFLDAAKRKLLLYGLSPDQVDKLSKDSMKPYVALSSPTSGVVTEIQITEGQYVEEGSPLYSIEDISSLWVEAELYPDEARSVKVGDKINVLANGSGSLPVEARVNYISPEYRANSQILVIRAEIKNPSLQFRPGQQAQVFLAGETRQVIAVPTDAVIRGVSTSHVYVQSRRAIFRPRLVKTGMENFDHVEITEGLNEGDTIAVTGAYLLYSEMVLKKGGVGL